MGLCVLCGGAPKKEGRGTIYIHVKTPSRFVFFVCAAVYLPPCY